MTAAERCRGRNGLAAATIIRHIDGRVGYHPTRALRELTMRSLMLAFFVLVTGVASALAAGGTYMH